MIYLEPAHKDIILNIFAKYPYDFYVFGSRVTGKHHRYSDLDLYYKQAISIKELTRISTELEESDLPFTVDLVDYKKCKPWFRAQLDKYKELLK